VTEAPIRLLLVEDDRVDQMAFSRMAQGERWPFDATLAGSLAEARTLLASREFDVVVTDYLLGDGVGLDLFPLLGSAPVIVTTASGNEEVAVLAMKSGATDYLVKDPQRNYLKVLPLTVQRALERCRAVFERERLMRDLTARSDELSRANRELTLFSYAVAHDLRAPVRSIRAIARMLCDGQLQRLDPAGVKLLQALIDSGDKMDRLLEGLLALYRLVNVKPNFVDVDLSALAAEAAQALAEAEPGRQVDLRIQPGLRAVADPMLMADALANLMGNAWKFTSRHASARIEFGASVSDGETVYVVRDDGAGFDPAHAAQLFEPFKRMHPSDRFPGTGIGLASVRRIIEHHGGRVWADAVVEGGASVYFTLAATSLQAAGGR